MGWILGKLGSLFMYFCTATVLALAIGLAYAYSNGLLDRPKVVRMAAIAHGVELSELMPGDEVKLDEDDGEQPSYQDIEEVRALKSRDLDLKLQLIAVQFKEFQHLQDKLKTDRERYEIVRSGFQQDLEEMKKSTTSGGVAEVRLALESIKPRQAKDQILRMVERGEINQVVTLVSGMEDNKRAKIFSEFRDEDESKIMSDILRLIRVGGQQARLIENTQEKLDRARRDGGTL